MAHTISFSDEDYKKAAEKWKKELLLIPMMAAKDSLRFMTGIPGVRGKLHVGTAASNAQFGPYKASKSSSSATEVKYRELETFFGNACEDFEPNSVITTLLGEGASFLGEGQKVAPSAKLVIATVAKSLGEALHNALFTAKRNESGDTTADLFNGFTTIADAEVEAGNISTEKGNLLKIPTGFSEADAIDVAKSIERKAHPVLRATEKFLYCSPEFADAYNDAYMLTHGGIVYNKKFEQTIVEGSNNKTTLAPLTCLSGSSKFFLAQKSNMLYGYDNMSDAENIQVDRFKPWFLTLSAAMFFGVQFYSIDPRMLLMVDATQG
ncbi:hypothetical protein [Barnesiella viscericola]|uniref:hypothetical protein n=1 Tax=Barnesiella viscericola TaxID=397865 RepID=UPI00248F1CC7|nr:hypothetical protein [Barnesiella viscericola]